MPRTCQHGKRASQCKDCPNAYELCAHKVRLPNCKKCGGKYTQKIHCEVCDCEISRAKFKRHLKTPKHLSNIIPFNYPLHEYKPNFWAHVHDVELHPGKYNMMYAVWEPVYENGVKRWVYRVP